MALGAGTARIARHSSGRELSAGLAVSFAGTLCTSVAWDAVGRSWLPAEPPELAFRGPTGSLRFYICCLDCEWNSVRASGPRFVRRTAIPLRRTGIGLARLYRRRAQPASFGSLGNCGGSRWRSRW